MLILSLKNYKYEFWGFYIVRMYKVLMITNPSVVVVVPNRLSKQALTAVLQCTKTAWQMDYQEQVLKSVM